MGRGQARCRNGTSVPAKAKSVKARREKPLVLTQDEWNFLADAAITFAGDGFLHDPLSKKMGRNGERAYRRGVAPSAKGGKE